MDLSNFTHRTLCAFCICLSILASALYRVKPVLAEAESVESFTHEMMLDPVPGLPSTVAVRIQNPKIVKVRLHIVVDEELFVVPLQGAAETEFTATFPSPKEKVRYSFQFVSEDEKTAMSQPYLRRQTCAQTSDPSTDVRSKLVAQATELETISEQLMYLTQSIEGLKQ